MKEIIKVKTLFLAAVGWTGGCIAQLFGGWTEDLVTLLIFMAADYLTGLLVAAIWKKSGKSETGALSSWSAWKGLVRKGVTLLIVLAAHRLDLLTGTDCIRTGVVIAFCSNELISITENAGIMGVPLPAAVIGAIDILKAKSESEGK